MIGTSQRVIFAWAMGITQHSNAVDNVFSIANTALLTGNAGKEGAGTMPIRGHSNVQGFGSMGVTILLKEEIMHAINNEIGNLSKSATLEVLKSLFKLEVSSSLTKG